MKSQPWVKLGTHQDRGPFRHCRVEYSGSHHAEDGSFNEGTFEHRRLRRIAAATSAAITSRVGDPSAVSRLRQSRNIALVLPPVSSTASVGRALMRKFREETPLDGELPQLTTGSSSASLTTVLGYLKTRELCMDGPLHSDSERHRKLWSA